MQVTSKLRTRLLVQNGIFVVLLVALAALIAFFAREYRTEYDLTQSSRNTLSQQTRDVLAKLGGPVKVTVFATRQEGIAWCLDQLRKRSLPLPSGAELYRTW